MKRLIPIFVMLALSLLAVAGGAGAANVACATASLGRCDVNAAAYLDKNGAAVPVDADHPLPVDLSVMVTTNVTGAQPTPGTTGGLSSYTVQPAASDNHAVIKNGAGLLYHMSAFNKSATVNYVRFYDAGTGFNGCNSATNLKWQGIIPASTSGAQYIETIPIGLTFGTGISICVTSGYATNDTTNATATSIVVNVGYK